MRLFNFTINMKKILTILFLCFCLNAQADNLTISQGSGTTMASDDVGGVNYQRSKIALGIDGVYGDTGFNFIYDNKVIAKFSISQIIGKRFKKKKKKVVAK